MSNLEHLIVNPQLKIQNGSIEDLDTCIEMCQNVDTVFHLAARASVPESMTDPLGYHGVNVTGTLNVLKAAVDGGVKRFVNVGSSAAYGVATQLPITEANAVSFLSPYAASKYTQEVYAQMMCEAFGLSTMNLRFFNVFGPGQRVGSAYAAVIPMFIHKIVRGEPIHIFGDGAQTRDFVYVEDVVDALIKASQTDAAHGQILNVASGSRITIKDLADTLYRLMEAEPNITFAPERDGDIKDSYASIEKIKQVLDWQPQVDFEQALNHTIAWHRTLLG